MEKGDSEDSDLRQRLIVARGGWCEYYAGIAGDEPIAGGRYNDEEIGSEWENFRQFSGIVYGYVHQNLKPKRIFGKGRSDGEDIAVAFIATNPDGGGQKLVGWHRHAQLTLPVQYRNRPGSGYGVYLWTVRRQNTVLLPLNSRTLDIPKGKGATGQAQTTYTREVDGRLKSQPWIAAVRKFIRNYDGPSLTDVDRPSATRAVSEREAERAVSGQGILSNAMMRIAIENRAMKLVKKELVKRFGADVTNVSGTESYDFHCGLGRDAVKVEVKGTRTAGDTLLFSRAEVDLAKRERVDLYVVTNIRISGDEFDGYAAAGGNVEHVPDWGRLGFSAVPVAYQVVRK